MNTIKYSIPAINCMHCVHTIKQELSELEGVKNVEADVVKKEVVVQFEMPATLETIEKLLYEINFPAIKIN
ncbi:MAG: heavy metal-associated domain-containing protein [Chloroflexi bacterium]|nr:heavy metal-associated domain-containing protein [Chloroflexota bacterium]